MTDLDEARDALAEFRGTPATSTRRRCRLGVRLMDIIGEYRERLINGAELVITSAGFPDQPDATMSHNMGAWMTMLDLYRQCNAEIDALGYTRNELQIAAATAIFDAVIESKT